MEPLSHRRVAELRRRDLLAEVARSRRSTTLCRPRHAPPPRAVLYPVVIVLACLTIVVLLGLASAFTAAHPRPDSGALDAAIAARFYAALNRALATGDPTELDNSVWPEVVVFRADGQEWDLADLKRHLAALHAVRPRLSLRVDEMVADDHHGVAAIALVGAGEGGPIAVPDNRIGAAGWTDRFRVSQGRVIEYAGVLAELSVPPWPFAARVVALPETPRARVALTRLTLQPGAESLRLVAGGPALYRVEAGEVHLWHSWSETDVGSGFRLRPGEQAVVAGDGAHVLRAIGTAPGDVIAAALQPDPPMAPYRPSGMASPTTAESTPITPRPPGVEIASLGELALDLGAIGLAREGAVALDRLALPPGRHRLAHPGNSAVVLFVESGQGVLAAPGGPPGRAAPPATVLAPGSAVALAPDNRPTVSNTGPDPLVLLVVTLLPIAPAAPATPQAVVPLEPPVAPPLGDPPGQPTRVDWSSTRERQGKPH